MDRRDFMAAGGALALPLAASAQARPKDVLVVANEFGPNSLDIHTVGANRASYGVSWLAYDRLMSYGKKTLPDGRHVHGFLCEAHALEGARDITELGGWRAYLRSLSAPA